MNHEPYHPWLHRFAVATACVTLVPIAVGAVVTTLDAGMAFPDWPSSDGHNMFAYPWLKSAGDKFVEHGHRLAGVVIGLMSIALTAVVWICESRRWVRVAGTLVLVGVVVQGILGGVRVLADDRMMALVHGNFAAWVFTLVACVALVTSRSWWESAHAATNEDVSSLKPLAIVTPAVVLTQYLLGGAVRHFGLALHEHLGFAFVALLFILMTVVAAHRSRVSWLRRAGYLLLGLVLLQITLGAGAWITKFGFPAAGYVAVQHSPLQVAIRTGHTVVGMFVFMMAVNFSVRVFRLDFVARRFATTGLHRDSFGEALSLTGGTR